MPTTAQPAKAAVIGCGIKSPGCIASSKITRVDLSTLANVATALAVITGVFFALLEARRARQDREERAAFTTVRALFTPAWITSANYVQQMPEGTTIEQIEGDRRLFKATHSVLVILEGLGYSVFARVIPLHVVDDLRAEWCAAPGGTCVLTSNTSAS